LVSLFEKGALKTMFPRKRTLMRAGAILLVALFFGGSPATAQDRAAEAEKEAAALRKKVVDLEIQLKAMLEKVRAQEIEIQRLNRELAARGAAQPKPANNPPAEDVKGVVRKVDGKLVTINIGSDAGLVRGHTLEVFRLGKQPKYLGRIKIVEVKAKEAVGQEVGRMLDKVQAGDEVASRLAGGK
jgi:hypothetical protein